MEENFIEKIINNLRQDENLSGNVPYIRPLSNFL